MPPPHAPTSPLSWHQRRHVAGWLAGGLMAALVWPATVVAQSTEPARAWLETWRAGALTPLDDATVIQRFQSLPPEVLAASLKMSVQGLNSYELWVLRQERLKGVFNDRPFVNHLKYTHAPRRLYVKWLDGGPNAGQEMIYDETRRPDQVYGHLGGLLNIRSVWLSFDSSIIRGNTQHHLRDELSLQYFVGAVAAQMQAAPSAGGAPIEQIEVVGSGANRQIRFTLAPATVSGRPPTGRVRASFDVAQPMIRQFERWDMAGQLQTRIVMERVRVGPLQDADFDPANPTYKF